MRRHAGHVAVTGLLGVSCYNTLVYVAGHTTAALNLSLLGICSPIFIVVLARLFAGEAITLRRAVGILVAASGVVVLVVGSPTRLTGVRVAPGDLWMLAATVLFAGYSLLVRRRPTEIDLPAFTLATFAFGVTALLPAYLAELIVVGPFRIDARIAGALVYVGLGASVAAFFAWNRAIDLVGAARPALLYYLVPVLTGLGGWAFLGESLHPGQVMSMALVVGGTIIGTKGSPSGRASSGDS